jgi:hypothetical protein
MEGCILDFLRHGRRLSGGTPGGLDASHSSSFAEVHKRPPRPQAAAAVEPPHRSGLPHTSLAASPRALGSAQSSRAA